MNHKIYVIDTSYLLELYKVPGFSTPSSYTKIKDKFKSAIENAFQLHVPFPCILEFGNHIADVKNGKARKTLGEQFSKAIKSSIEESSPWIISPLDERLFVQKCELFSNVFLPHRLSLTDTFVIQEAKRLKDKYKSFKYSVHIWTKDENMKAREPDNEPDAFLG